MLYRILHKSGILHTAAEHNFKEKSRNVAILSMANVTLHYSLWGNFTDLVDTHDQRILLRKVNHPLFTHLLKKALRQF